MRVHYSSATDLYETPAEFFARLDSEFHFTLDVCATKENAKCPEFFTRDDDGLSRDWGKCADGAVWMNPPYGRTIGEWIHKAARESKEHGITVVCLIPARTDASWWHEIVLREAKEVRFVRGRLDFAGPRLKAPFPSAVVIFAPHARAHCSVAHCACDDYKAVISSITNGRTRRVPSWRRSSESVA
jgi:site-specific DNA-methyltransferase (adenine-specific)